MLKEQIDGAMKELRLLVYDQAVSGFETLISKHLKETNNGTEVLTTFSQYEAEELIKQGKVDAFFYVQEERNNPDFLQYLHSKSESISVVVVSDNSLAKQFKERIIEVKSHSINIELLLLLIEKDISNRKLNSELRSLKTSLKTSDIRFRALNDVFNFKTNDEQELLDFALQKAIELTGSNFGYIYKYSEEKEQFTLNSWSSGVMKECEVLDPQTCYELNKTGFWGEAVRQRKPIILNDFKAENPLKKGYPEGHVELQRFMTTPIFERDKIVAVIGVANKEEEYTNKDVQQLQLLLSSVWNLLDARNSSNTVLQLSKAVESSKASIVITNQKGEIEYANPYFFQHTGFTEADVVGKTPRVLKSGHHSKDYYDKLWKTISTGNTWEGELKNKKKNGEIYWESAVISPIINVNGVISHYVAVKTDITKAKENFQELEQSKKELEYSRKTLVESEKNQSELLNSVGQEVFSIDKNYKVLTFNKLWADGFKQYMGFEIKKGDRFGELGNVEDYSKVWKPLFESSFEGKSVSKKMNLFLPNGELKVVKVAIKPLRNYNEEIIGSCANIDDVTELEQAGEVIKDNAKIIDTALEISHIYPWSFDIRKQLFSFNAGVSNFFNEPIKSAVKKEILYQKFHKEDRDRVIEQFEGSFEKGSFELEHRYSIANKVKWVKVKGLLNDDKNKVVGVMQDITAQKEMMQQLESSEKLKASVIDALSEGLVVQDKNDNIVLANVASATVLGLTIDQLLGKTSFDPLWQAHDKNNKPIAPEDHPSMVTLRTGNNIDGFIMKVHTGTGESKVIKINSRPIKDEDGVVLRAVTSFIDISKERNAEEKLRETSDRLEWALQGTNAALWDLNLLTGKTVVDKRWSALLGFKPEELGVITFDVWKDLLHPDDFGKTMSTLNDFVNGRSKDYGSTFRMKTKSGDYIWIWGQATAVDRNEKGEVVRMIGTNQSIHKLATSEIALRESEEKYRSLTESINQIIWKADKVGNITFVNNPGLKILGKELIELQEQGWLSIIHENDIKITVERWTRSLESKVPYLNEQRMQQANGAYHWYKVSAQPQLDSNGNLVGWVGLSIDINNEKIVSEKVLDLKERYSLATEATSDAIWDWQVGEKTLKWNAAYKRNFGDYEQANTYRKWIRLVHPNDKEDVREQLIRPLKTLDIDKNEFEFRMLQADSSYAYIRCRCIFIRDAKRDVVRVVGSLENITQERLSLLKQELRYAFSTAINDEHIFERQLHAAIGVLGSFLKCDLAEAWLVDLEGAKLKKASNFATGPGYTEIFNEKKEIYADKSNGGLNLMAWNSGEIQIENIIEEKNNFSRAKTASLLGFKTVIALPVFNHDKVVAVFILLSKQKRDYYRLYEPLLDELKNDLGVEVQKLRKEDEQKQFFELSPDLFCIAGFDGYFKKINSSFVKLLGSSESDILATPFIDNVLSDDKEITVRFFESLNKKPSETLYFENRYLTKTNKIVWLAWTVVYIETEDLIYAVAKDFTERMKYTKAIESQNQRLKEIAWTQSHILRAPLVNIMGLVNLLEMGVEQQMDIKTILKAMKNSTSEFDKVIKDITRKSEVLYEQIEGEK